MIRPANFGFNEETAKNNAFQKDDGSLSAKQIKNKALEEFDLFVQKLRDRDVHVIVHEEDKEPVKPDAVFPNNWISFHQDGTLITYPMYSEKRRQERSEKVIDQLEKDFEVSNRYAFEQYEFEDQYLEGTGSMILDRVHKVVYACLSPRTDILVLDKFCVLRGYSKVVFHATDENAMDIYHTNVMMALGKDYVVICLDCIRDEDERNFVQESLKKSGKKIITISFDQVNAFAGNMLQVQSRMGTPYLIMSSQAYASLSAEQILTLNAFNEIIHSPIPTIETYGGGSTRCMMAEVFLPEKRI